MDDSLLLLANEVRSKTLWLLDDLTEDMARFAAPGLTNTILWHAGHVLVVVEHLAIAPAAGGLPQVPQGWFDIFGWDSRPRLVIDWPAIADVIAELRGQLPRLISALAALTPSHLNQVHDQASGTTLRYDILHGLHDEANHQGEMWLLKKMYRKTAC